MENDLLKQFYLYTHSLNG